MEEPALLHQTLPTKKKAFPTLVKKTIVSTDSKKDKKQNKYNKCDQNNEKVCGNIRSSTSGKKQLSVVTNNNKKKVQNKEFDYNESHDEVSDTMKRTPKVSTFMELSFTPSLQISFLLFTWTVLLSLKRNWRDGISNSL